MEFLSELGLVRHDNQEAGCLAFRQTGLVWVTGERYFQGPGGRGVEGLEKLIASVANLCQSNLNTIIKHHEHFQ